LRHLPLLACATVLLAACNSAEDSADEAVTAPTPELTVAAVPTAAPDGTALVPGAWAVTEDASGASATFGEPGGAPAMTIACNTKTRAVTLTRVGAATAPEAYVLEAGGQAARLDMVPSADGAGMSAAIEPALPIFAAFSDPASAIALTSPAGEKLQYPSNAGIRRVLDACS
jgi:hypothetical protein